MRSLLYIVCGLLWGGWQTKFVCGVGGTFVVWTSGLGLDGSSWECCLFSLMLVLCFC